MDVNETFEQFGNFWGKVYPLIIFHIVFYLMYNWIFEKFPLRDFIARLLESDRYIRFKVMLRNLEMLKTMPFILLGGILLYLTIFRNVVELSTDVNVFPLSFTYSPSKLIQSNAVRDQVLTVMLYNKEKDTIEHYSSRPEKLFYFIEKQRDEYKAKSPEIYERYCGWLDEQVSGNMLRYKLVLFLDLSLIVISLVRIRRKNKKYGFFKIALVLLLSIPILFVLRYRIEQKMENKLAGELYFTAHELEMDKTQSPIRTIEEAETAFPVYPHPQMGFLSYPVWLSDFVEMNPTLERLLGKRRLPLGLRENGEVLF